MSLNQSGLLQRLEVLRDGGLSERQLLHKLTAQARLPLGEGLEDGDAGGVPEGFRPRRQLDGFRGEGLGGCCNHDILSLIDDERWYSNQKIGFRGKQLSVNAVLRLIISRDNACTYDHFRKDTAYSWGSSAEPILQDTRSHDPFGV